MSLSPNKGQNDVYGSVEVAVIQVAPSPRIELSFWFAAEVAVP